MRPCPAPGTVGTSRSSPHGTGTVGRTAGQTGHWPGRDACATSRTRKTNHLAALSKKLCKNLLDPLKIRQKSAFWQDLQPGWAEVPCNHCGLAELRWKPRWFGPTRAGSVQETHRLPPENWPTAVRDSPGRSLVCANHGPGESIDQIDVLAFDSLRK